MAFLVLGLVIFLGAHVFTTLRGPRARLIDRVGEGAYKGLYSVVTLIGLVLVIYGYGQYRAHDWIQVWDPPVCTRHLTLPLVLVAFIYVVAAYVPGRIKAVLKHPMLAGVKIWAVAHLLANGDLGSMVLFGSILVWAILARISVKRRRDEVRDHAGPLASPSGWRNDVVTVVVGAAAWFVFARWLHPWLIGVSVWPHG